MIILCILNSMSFLKKKKKKNQFHNIQSHISKGCPIYKRCWGVARRCIINFSGEGVVRCIRFSKRSNFEWINTHKWIKLTLKKKTKKVLLAVNIWSCLHLAFYISKFSLFPSCFIWFCISPLCFILVLHLDFVNPLHFKISFA